MLSSSAPVLSIAFTDEKWVLPARAEAANRSIATGNTYCSMDDCPERDNMQINLHCGKRNETSNGLTADHLIDTITTLSLHGQNL